MKELNFLDCIVLFTVICFISTILLIFYFFSYYFKQRTTLQLNINHQSIDSGFGKLYQFFEFKLLPFSFSIIVFIFIFQIKHKDVKKKVDSRMNALPETKKKPNYKTSVDSGLVKKMELDNRLIFLCIIITLFVQKKKAIKILGIF